jgi:hypothetical protein
MEPRSAVRSPAETAPPGQAATPHRRPCELAAAAERLRTVLVENLPATRIIAMYGLPDAARGALRRGAADPATPHLSW